MAGSTAARRRLIRRLIQEHHPSRQQELVDLLAAAGHTVTQATVSRDLDALGAAKARDDEGGHYTIPRIPDGRGSVAEMVNDFVSGIRPSGNLVVLRTPPGAAHMVAGAIDRAEVDGVLGTVAGDDTIIIVTSQPNGGKALAASLDELSS